jgi:ribosomal protein S18 acetylase RimI-like enzyme
MQYVLRFARDSDKGWLEQLRRLAYRELFYATWGHWDESRHQRQFADCWQRGRIQLVEIDGHPVGMLQLFESDELLEVGEIQIAPEHQGTGIGTRLLCDVIARARERDKDVVLSTGLMNLRAAGLYERLGFEETERSDTHIHSRYYTRLR